MKEEIEGLFSLINDYKDGVGGVTDAFIMNELKCLVNEAQHQVKKCDLADVGDCSELDIERSASKCVNQYEKKCTEKLSIRDKVFFMDGYKFGVNACGNKSALRNAAQKIVDITNRPVDSALNLQVNN